MAANAEESAGTSEEIRSQAGQIYRIGLDPAGLIDGSSTDAAEKVGTDPDRCAVLFGVCRFRKKLRYVKFLVFREHAHHAEGF